MLEELGNLPNKNERSEPVLNQEKCAQKAPIFPLWKRGVCLAIGLLGIFTLTLIVSFFVFWIPKSDQDGATALIVYALLFAAMVGFVFVDIPKFLHIFRGWKPYVFGIAFGIGIVALDIAYSNFINLFYQLETGGNETSIRSVIDIYPVASALIFGILGPFIEEMAYRVGLFGLLKKVNIVLAYVLASLIFGFLHFDFTATNIAAEFIILPSYVLSGTAFCVAYDLFGLPCSWTAHSFNNLWAVIGYVVINNIE